MSAKFQKSLKIGQAWEERMEVWMDEHFSGTKWDVVDTRDIYRDADGDQYPDYELVDIDSDQKCFIDAKKRNVYTIMHKKCFGFDEKLYRSYTNIANKYNSKTYVGFHDPVFDPDHVYILDVAQVPTFRVWFNNEHGQGAAYRWCIDDLLKYKL